MTLTKLSCHMALGILTAEQTPLTGTAGLNPLDSVISLLAPIVFLAFILFLAFQSVRLIRKKHEMQGSAGSQIEILERAMLGPDKYLAVVRLRGTVLLLGVSTSQISRLAELDSSLYEGIPPSASAGDSFTTLFRDTLDKSFGSLLGEKKE